VYLGAKRRYINTLPFLFSFFYYYYYYYYYYYCDHYTDNLC